MAHDRNTGSNHFFDQRANFTAAFEFNCRAAAFFQETSGIHKTFRFTRLITHERHVTNDKCVFSATDDSLRMMNHRIHRDRNS